MHIKRFEAENLETALEQVRATLGPNALILSSRSIARGRSAFGLFAKTGVEVQAGIERGLEFVSPSESNGAEESEASLERTVDALRLELAALRRRAAFEEELRSELAGLRQSVVALHTRAGGSRTAGDDEAMAERLVRRGLDPRHAHALGAEEQAARVEGIPFSLRRRIAQRIDACLAVPRSDPDKPFRVFVGPPGSGKTTTLAKLAARNEEGERDVAFVSLGASRIEGRDSLRAYAALVDAPYYELQRIDALADIARRHPGHDILVDSAGRARGDLAEQDPIEGLRAALGERVSIELVLDATTRLDVARRQRARFAAARPDRLILTRVDECESLVPLVNCLLDGDWPALCWWGTGQRVPEDLEIVEPERLVASLLGHSA